MFSRVTIYLFLIIVLSGLNGCFSRATEKIVEIGHLSGELAALNEEVALKKEYLDLMNESNRLLERDIQLTKIIVNLLVANYYLELIIDCPDPINTQIEDGLFQVAIMPFSDTEINKPWIFIYPRFDDSGTKVIECLINHSDNIEVYVDMNITATDLYSLPLGLYGNDAACEVRS